MSSRLHSGLAMTALAFLFSINPVNTKAQVTSITPEQAQVVNSVSTVFAAALTDDVAKFDSVIAPGFYMYDGGSRFNGDSVMALIKAQHEAGKRYVWKVTEPDVHIKGKTAWIAYVNQGSITDATGTKRQIWLESAFLQRQAGSWKIVFMHSTRVPMAAQ